jgi:phosphatidylinositol alpha-1,6-mannosyltransferase
MTVLVVSPAVPTGLGGITTYANGVRDVVATSCPVRLVAPRANSPVGAALLVVVTWIAALRHRPRLVHALTWRVAAPLALLPRPLRPRLIVHCLGSELRRVGAVTGWIRDRVLARADELVAISAFTASVVQDVAPREAVVVPPVHESPRPAPRHRSRGVGPLRLLSVARMYERKGQPELVRLVDELRAGGVDCTLTVAGGDGPCRAELEAFARSRDWFHLSVGPSDDELDGLYADADVFVLLTTDDGDEFEGFGIVFLEAAAAGLPVVATASGGVRDAVADGETGFVVRDKAEAGSVLRQLATDPVLLERLAQAGPRHVERFSVGAIAAQFEALGLLRDR